MTRLEQAEFVNELIATVQAELNSRLSRVPENWDGIELRQWIADEFAAQAWQMDKARKMNYENDKYNF